MLFCDFAFFDWFINCFLVLARRKLISTTHNTPETLIGHKRKVEDNEEESTARLSIKRTVIDLASGVDGSFSDGKDDKNGGDMGPK